MFATGDSDQIGERLIMRATLFRFKAVVTFGFLVGLPGLSHASPIGLRSYTSAQPDNGTFFTVTNDSGIVSGPGPVIESASVSAPAGTCPGSASAFAQSSFAGLFHANAIATADPSGLVGADASTSQLFSFDTVTVTPGSYLLTAILDFTNLNGNVGSSDFTVANLVFDAGPQQIVMDTPTPSELGNPPPVGKSLPAGSYDLVQTAVWNATTTRDVYSRRKVWHWRRRSWGRLVCSQPRKLMQRARPTLPRPAYHRSFIHHGQWDELRDACRIRGS